MIDSRYPLKQSECDYLAGLQAHIEQRGYYGTTHTPAFYKYVCYTVMKCTDRTMILALGNAQKYINKSNQIC